jgi:hypothetical protein
VLASQAFVLHTLPATPHAALMKSLSLVHALGMRSGHDGVDPFQWTVWRLGHKRLSTGSGAGAQFAIERPGLWVTARS